MSQSPSKPPPADKSLAEYLLRRHAKCQSVADSQRHTARSLPRRQDNPLGAAPDLVDRRYHLGGNH